MNLFLFKILMILNCCWCYMIFTEGTWWRVFYRSDDREGGTYRAKQEEGRRMKRRVASISTVPTEDRPAKLPAIILVIYKKQTTFGYWCLCTTKLSAKFNLIWTVCRLHEGSAERPDVRWLPSARARLKHQAEAFGAGLVLLTIEQLLPATKRVPAVLWP